MRRVGEVHSVRADVGTNIDDYSVCTNEVDALLERGALEATGESKLPADSRCRS